MYSEPQNARTVALDELTQALQGATLDAATFLRSPPNERGECLCYSPIHRTLSVRAGAHGEIQRNHFRLLAFADSETLSVRPTTEADAAAEADAHLKRIILTATVAEHGTGYVTLVLQDSDSDEEWWFGGELDSSAFAL